MNSENLVAMANQIGAYFSVYPDQDEARREIANHLCKFWAPRMRSALLEHIDTSSPSGLDPLVLAAVTNARTELTPHPDGSD